MSALLALLAIGLGACGDDGDDAAAGPPETIRRGTLVVGSAVPFPPFEFGPPPDYEGFDVDLVREIARRLDLRVEMRDLQFDDLLDATARRRVDVAAAALTITDERKQEVAFSQPYFRADQAIAARSGSDARGDLAGERVGVLVDSTSETYAEQHTEARRIVPFDYIDEAFDELADGKLDAVLSDLPNATAEIDERRGVAVVRTIPTNDLYGLALSKRSAATLEAVNRVLGEMKSDGSFERLYERWFEAPPPDAVVTAR